MDYTKKREAEIKACLPALANLKADAVPQWGVLSAQGMLEHLTLGIKIGNGSLAPRGAVPYDEYDEARKQQVAIFVASEAPYARNIMNPLMQDKPFQTRKPNLEAAKDWFREELDLFFRYWEENPDATRLHPTLGPLPRDDWYRFEYRHIMHHFGQFGLLADTA
jgi:oxepin-CoA hydrolase/3-oxo-5,6-dehydrosuberyl-CoA semialdehyde dehydrogenase